MFKQLLLLCFLANFKLNAQEMIKDSADVYIIQFSVIENNWKYPLHGTVLLEDLKGLNLNAKNSNSFFCSLFKNGKYLLDGNELTMVKYPKEYFSLAFDSDFRMKVYNLNKRTIKKVLNLESDGVKIILRIGISNCSYAKMKVTSIKTITEDIDILYDVPSICYKHNEIYFLTNINDSYSKRIVRKKFKCDTKKTARTQPAFEEG